MSLLGGKKLKGVLDRLTGHKEAKVVAPKKKKRSTMKTAAVNADKVKRVSDQKDNLETPKPKVITDQPKVKSTGLEPPKYQGNLVIVDTVMGITVYESQPPADKSTH